MPLQRLLTGIWGWSHVHAAEEVVQLGATTDGGGRHAQPAPPSTKTAALTQHGAERAATEHSSTTTSTAEEQQHAHSQCRHQQHHQHHHHHRHRRHHHAGSSSKEQPPRAFFNLGGAAVVMPSKHQPSQQQQQQQQPSPRQQGPASPVRCHARVLLPPQQGPPRKTLVLDLDKTLIDCISLRDKSPPDYDFVYTDDQGTQAKVWTRPFLRQFLVAASQSFELVLFTAAGQRHADSVLKQVDAKGALFAHRLYGQHTSDTQLWSWAKDLSRLGRPLEHTLLVDDSQLAGLLQPCNLVPIRPFSHDHPQRDVDTALSDLLRFLVDKVAPASDVRNAIALHWDKTLRRPRKRPLQPRVPPGSNHDLSLDPAASTTCSCSCHLAHAAALPPPRLTDPTSTTTTAASTATAAIATRDGSGGGEVNEPVGWHRCSAVHDGCGCMYDGATDMAALVAAYQLHHQAASWAAHADDQEARCCACCGQGPAASASNSSVLPAADTDADGASSAGDEGSGGGGLKDAGSRVLGMRRSPKRYLELGKAQLQQQQQQQQQQQVSGEEQPDEASPTSVLPARSSTPACAVDTAAPAAAQALPVGSDDSLLSTATDDLPWSIDTTADVTSLASTPSVEAAAAATRGGHPEPAEGSNNDSGPPQVGLGSGCSSLLTPWLPPEVPPAAPSRTSSDSSAGSVGACVDVGEPLVPPRAPHLGPSHRAGLRGQSSSGALGRERAARAPSSGHQAAGTGSGRTAGAFESWSSLLPEVVAGPDATAETERVVPQQLEGRVRAGRATSLGLANLSART